MVRAIAGTLVQVGLGKISRQQFKAVVEARDRKAAADTAPANGLYLIDVSYTREGRAPKDDYLEPSAALLQLRREA
jgi:tRNA pseudouridine38-40 synthase